MEHKQKLVFFSIGIFVLSLLFLPAPSNKITTQSYCPNQIKDSQILLYTDKIVINDTNLNVENGSIIEGGSMLPTIVPNKTTLLIRNITNIDNLCVGDIIIFNNSLLDCKRLSVQSLILHRIISKDIDKEGIYFYTKGDNNYFEDKCKVRKDNIKFVLIGMLY